MRLIVLTSLFAAGVIAACGSNGSSTFNDGNNGGDDGGIGPSDDSGLVLDAGQGDGNPFGNDPPPAWCGPDGGPTAPPPPGGSLNCPDDKNLPGCPCTKADETAPCWTGLRKNRSLGVCKDGTTTCKLSGENVLTWGDCTGETLPQAGATKGAPACTCFSKGQWKLTNLIPCFWTYNGVTTGVSTIIGDGGASECVPYGNSPPTIPPSNWSQDTLNVDCAGHFKLCYQLKAGDYNNPKPTDCALMPPQCVEADYAKENVEQPFPDIGPWISGDTACSTQFASTGGYGEMTVIGLSVRCDKVDDGNGNPYVFHRIQYCKQECVTNPSLPECQSCMQGGSGQF
jgi:hypothetical protein